MRYLNSLRFLLAAFLSLVCGTCAHAQPKIPDFTERSVLSALAYVDSDLRIMALYAGSPNKVVTLNPETGAVENTYALSAGNYSVISERGEYVASAQTGGGVAVYQLPKFSKVLTIGAESGPFKFLDLSPFDSVLLSCDFSGSVKLWRFMDGKLLNDGIKFPVPMDAAVFSQDGRYAAMLAASDVAVFDFHAGKINWLNPPGLPVYALAFSPLSDRLLLGSDGQVCLADPETGELDSECLPVGSGERVAVFGADPTARQIIAATANGVLLTSVFYKKANGSGGYMPFKRVESFLAPKASAPRKVAISSNGQYAAVGFLNNRVLTVEINVPGNSFFSQDKSSVQADVVKFASTAEAGISGLSRFYALYALAIAGFAVFLVLGPVKKIYKRLKPKHITDTLPAKENKITDEPAPLPEIKLFWQRQAEETDSHENVPKKTGDLQSELRKPLAPEQYAEPVRPEKPAPAAEKPGNGDAERSKTGQGAEFDARVAPAPPKQNRKEEAPSAPEKPKPVPVPQYWEKPDTEAEPAPPPKPKEKPKEPEVIEASERIETKHLLKEFENKPLIDNKYRITAEIGRGGMSIVYEGEDVMLGKKFALKKMRGEIATDKRDRERFMSEARITAKLKHPNIIDIYSIIEQPDDIYLVFELIEGKTLENLLYKYKRLPVRESVGISMHVLSALGYAHTKGVLHRDLKPSNIMVSKDGFVRVMDFGIARIIQSGSRAKTELSGTMAYMAPEQHIGAHDHRADIFAFGATLYEMLTGKLPYPGPNVLEQKKNKGYKPLTVFAPDLPERIIHIVEKCLEPDVNNRYNSAAEVYRSLKKCPIDSSESLTRKK
ncbi:MAG: protein kinase [Elusimicrobiaceae bacterium]